MRSMGRIIADADALEKHAIRRKDNGKNPPNASKY